MLISLHVKFNLPIYQIRIYILNSPAEKCNAVVTSLEAEYAFFFNLLLKELIKRIFPLVGIRFS